MIQELKDLEDIRLYACNLLITQKTIGERAYNKRVKQKTFGKGDLVWQIILPVTTNDPRYGKWLLNWEGPFIVYKVLDKGAYYLKDLKGQIHRSLSNSKFLNKYYLVTWEMRE